VRMRVCANSSESSLGTARRAAVVWQHQCGTRWCSKFCKYEGLEGAACMLDERHDCCVNCLAVRLQLLAAKCTANRYLGLGLLVSYMPLAPRLLGVARAPSGRRLSVKKKGCPSTIN